MMICVKHVGWVKKLVGIFFGSVRQLVKYGSSPGIIFETQGVRYNEFVDLVWYLIFIQHVGNDFLEMLFLIAWSTWHN